MFFRLKNNFRLFFCILLISTCLLLITNPLAFGASSKAKLDTPRHALSLQDPISLKSGILSLQREEKIQPAKSKVKTDQIPLHRGFPFYFDDGSTKGCYGSLTLADVNNDGAQEIIATNVANYVYVLNGYGETLKGWPVHLPSTYMNWHSSTVSDLNYDGQMEIIAVNEEGVFILNLYGEILASFPHPQDFYLQTPTVGNLDSIGNKEIIVLARGPNQARLYILSYDEETLSIVPYKGFPIDLQEANIADINTSPAVADFDLDGDLETVFLNFNFMSGQPTYLYLIHHDDPLMQTKGWKINVPFYSGRALAIGNTDYDRELEIATAGFVYEADGTLAGQLFSWNFMFSDVTIGDIDKDGVGEIIAQRERELFVAKYNPETKAYEVLWTVTNHQGYQPNSSALLADIDNDGDVEIVTYGSDNYINALEANGSIVNGFPFQVTNVHYVEWASPAIGDINGDGTLELILSPLSGPPAIYAWDLSYVDAPPSRLEWLMFEHDPEHTAKWELTK